PLHNPYAYGWFGSVEHAGLTGRPNTGGTIYLADAFPPQYRGAFLCGDFLGHTCSWWKVAERGSTIQMSLGDLLLDSHDTWFGATDLCLAPDGAVFVCDFFDQRTAHPDPDARWDRSNGRVYRVAPLGTRGAGAIDVGRKRTDELVALLDHPNGWYAEQARVQLAARRDPAALPALKMLARANEPRRSLQGLWGLYVSGGFDDALAAELLDHPGESVRAWTVRLLGDERKVSEGLSARL